MAVRENGNEGSWKQREQEKHQIFSKEALNKMRSPEKLDTMIVITSPVTWMGLIAVALTVFAVILWSIFGSFTVKADGMGMIMDSSGVSVESAGSAGRVTEVYVHPGEKVERGARIAHIRQAQQEASTRMAQYAPELSTSAREAAGRVHEFDSQRYQQYVTEYVRASHDGIVDEVFVDEGSMVSGGMPICNLRVDDGRSDLQGILYIPVDKGKRVEPGQTIQLAPNGVDVSQSGSLMGTVRSVSQYPASLQMIQKNLANEQLAQWIVQTQQSAVVEVNFDLVRDETNPSGYLWTSSVGEHKPVTAGSFCTGSVIVERRPPLQKVFYKLSQWLRSR